MGTSELTERRALNTADAKIAELQTALEAAARVGALDAETLARFRDTVLPAAAQLNQELLDDPDSESVREIAQSLVMLLAHDSASETPLDAADWYLIQLEVVRHAVRDLAHGRSAALSGATAAQVIESIEATLPSLTGAERADLLGVSVRQLQRRRHETGPPGSRELLVARLARVLSCAWTDAGVLAWFLRERPELGGLTPLSALDVPEYEGDLLMLARAGRVQGGS